ncbi:hypothetical protein AV530_012372 [Patagioenas fasciata monilis]|uniref:Uncharacterized protein n=1 Tax=Patagioenas fasciata monilis TaxID=372326 RepID=A0A1V4JB23_PATFA|nr:hypothetical protein AV530_012372 [Patagioenas fasciata monilis]
MTGKVLGVEFFEKCFEGEGSSLEGIQILWRYKVYFDTICRKGNNDSDRRPNGKLLLILENSALQQIDLIDILFIKNFGVWSDLTGMKSSCKMLVK